MQTVVDAANSAAQTASQLASSTAAAVGLIAHSHAEEHQHSTTLPGDATCGAVTKMDSVGLAVFEDPGVRHEVLVKINKLAIEDKRHGLKEVAALDLVVEGQEKKGIDYYHPQRYCKVHRPMGVDYIGEIEIEAGKSIHVRCHKPSDAEGVKATFHSIDTRPSAEGGAVFATGEPLGWFDY